MVAHLEYRLSESETRMLHFFALPEKLIKCFRLASTTAISTVLSLNTGSNPTLRMVMESYLSPDTVIQRVLQISGKRIGRMSRIVACGSCARPQCLYAASGLHFYRVSSKRGNLLSNLTGCIVHMIIGKPYFTVDGVTHALCNAHHLRELQALVEIEQEE